VIVLILVALEILFGKGFGKEINENERRKRTYLFQPKPSPRSTTPPRIQTLTIGPEAIAHVAQCASLPVLPSLTAWTHSLCL